MADGTYWKLENNIKNFYINNKKIGDFLATVKYFMSNKGMSSSNAHKAVLKIKKFEG
jgi:hypothetical protein